MRIVRQLRRTTAINNKLLRRNPEQIFCLFDLTTMKTFIHCSLHWNAHCQAVSTHFFCIERKLEKRMEITIGSFIRVLYGFVSKNDSRWCERNWFIFTDDNHLKYKWLLYIFIIWNMDVMNEREWQQQHWSDAMINFFFENLTETNGKKKFTKTNKMVKEKTNERNIDIEDWIT